MIRKYILFLPIILFFVSCADKERNLSSSDVIGCRMMELQGKYFFHNCTNRGIGSKNWKSF